VQNFSDNPVPWLENSTYRMHRFRSSASAIKGLTAEILVSMPTISMPGINSHYILSFGQITTAIIAYDRSPTYQRFASGQLTTIKEIIRAVGPDGFSDAPKAVFAIGQNV
jgi:peroxisomal coenzyme A diphosphatase NUDT7